MELSGCEWLGLQASSGPALLMKQNPWGGPQAQMGWRPATTSGAGLPNQKPALSRAGTPPMWPASVGQLQVRPQRSAAAANGRVAAMSPQSAHIGPPEQPLRAGSPPKQPAQPAEQPGPASVAGKGQAQPPQPADSALKVESVPQAFTAGGTQAQAPAGPASTPAARDPVSAELPAAVPPALPANTAIEQPARAPDESPALVTAGPGAAPAEPVATQAEATLKQEQAAEQQQGPGVEPTYGQEAAEKVDAADRGPGPMAVDDLVRHRRRERRQRELQEQHRWECQRATAE